MSPLFAWLRKSCAVRRSSHPSIHTGRLPVASDALDARQRTPHNANHSAAAAVPSYVSLSRLTQITQEAAGNAHVMTYCDAAD